MEPDVWNFFGGLLAKSLGVGAWSLEFISIRSRLFRHSDAALDPSCRTRHPKQETRSWALLLRVARDVREECPSQMWPHPLSEMSTESAASKLVRAPRH